MSPFSANLMGRGKARRRVSVAWRAGAPLWFLMLIVSGVAAAEPAAPADPPPPPRRVRRRYDSVVRIHVPGEVQTLPEAEKPAPERTNEGFNNTLRESPTSLGQYVSAPVVRLERRSDKEDKAKNDLWVITPVADLLGVTLSGTNAVVRAEWGWLADEIRVAMQTNRVARAAGAPAAESESEEEEAEITASIFRAPPPIIEHSTAAQGSRNDWRTAEMPRFDPRLSPRAEATDLPLPPSSAAGMERGAAPGGAPGVRDSGVASAPTPPPAETARLSAQRELEDFRAAHRMENLAPPTGPAFGESATRWATGASRSPMSDLNLPSSSPPAPERPLLTGAPENYGRRGDIFSSSFRTSSADGFSPFAGLSPSPPPADRGGVSSSVSRPSFQPTFGSAYDPLKPFDASGRALTEPRSRW